MNCPKHAESILHSKLSRLFPEIFKSGKRPFDPASVEVETSSLKEQPIEYDPKSKLDLVVKNAILFGAGEDPVCIGIAGKVITRIAAEDELEPFTRPDTVCVDAANFSVLPGFTDSHLHLSVAMERSRACSVPKIKDAGQFKDRLQRFSRERPEEPVLYLFDLHYQDPPVIPAEKCRQFLDEIEDKRPVVVFAHDLHTVWANTQALKDAGLFKKTPPYPPLAEELGLEDKIVLGADGRPSGEFREPEVAYFLTGPLEARFPVPIDKKLDDLESVCRDLASHGITNVHNMALAQPAEDISFLLLLLELEQKGRLPIRVCTSFSALADDKMLEDVHRAYIVRECLLKARNKQISAAELHDKILERLSENGNARHHGIMSLLKEFEKEGRHPKIGEILAHSKHIYETIKKRYQDPHTERKNPHDSKTMPEYISAGCKIRCDTIKIFMDGVIEKGTAYRQDEKPSEGIPEFTKEELVRLIEFADKLGMQVAAHSIGDASVRSMLESIYKVRQTNSSIDTKRGHSIPHRVEHIELCRKEDVDRFGKEDVVTSMQPLHEREPVTLWHKLVPEEEWDTAFPWKSVLKNKAVLVFGSDWPIVSCDVREGIHHAVSRKPWKKGCENQGISLSQALDAYTQGPAFTEYSSRIKGSISAGMLADIVILSGRVEDLEDKEPSSLDILMTICDGKIVYNSNRL